MLPEDTIKEIMLYADIDTLPMLFNINVKYNKLCNNTFWIEKLRHDHLPLYNYQNRTTKEWIMFYRKTKIIYDEVSKIITTADKTIDISLPKNIQLDFLPASLFYLPYIMPFAIIYDVKNNTLKSYTRYQNQTFSASVVIDRAALYAILFQLFFQETLLGYHYY